MSEETSAATGHVFPDSVEPERSSFRKVVAVSVIYIIIGVACTCFGILAMVMDSNYKEENIIYWSSNGGTGLCFGGLMVLVGLIGIIFHTTGCQESNNLKHVHYIFLVIVLVAQFVFAIIFSVAIWGWNDYSKCEGNLRTTKIIFYSHKARPRCGSCYYDEETCISNFRNGAKYQLGFFCMLTILAGVAASFNYFSEIHMYRKEFYQGKWSFCCMTSQQRRRQQDLDDFNTSMTTRYSTSSFPHKETVIPVETQSSPESPPPAYYKENVNPVEPQITFGTLPPSYYPSTTGEI